MAALLAASCGSDADTAEPAAGETGTGGTEEFDAEEYFAGQRITIIVGSNPGGGYDLTARTFAEYIPEYVPGSPSVVVQNIPQGAHLLGMQTTMKADPDGYTLGLMAPRWTLPFVLGVDVEGLDLENAQYIGSATGDARSQVTCFPRELASTWQEVLDRGLEVVTGGSEAGSISGIVHGWLENQGFPVKKILGYGGTAEVDEAVRRGELNAQGNCQTMLRAFKYPEWEGDYWAPLWRVGPDEPEPELEEILERMDAEVPPQLRDLVPMSEEAQLGFDIVQNVDAFNRTFFLPPGTPDHILEAWVDAFNEIVKDPEFVTTMTDVAELTVEPVTGDVIKQTFLDLRQQLIDSGTQDEVKELVELEQLE